MSSTDSFLRHITIIQTADADGSGGSKNETNPMGTKHMLTYIFNQPKTAVGGSTGTSSSVWYLISASNGAV